LKLLSFHAANIPAGGSKRLGEQEDYAASICSLASRKSNEGETIVNPQFQEPADGRLCFREPIPEIADAARFLDAAASAHLRGRSDLAEELIRLADIPEIAAWVESILGSKSPYVQYRDVSDAQPHVSKEERVTVRMPRQAEKHSLHLRDGYCCRFCGIPVIRRAVRDRIRKLYPRALRWGKPNVERHAAFFAMRVQYDHVVPHARGGNNDIDNIVITCAPCNFGRMSYTLEEVGLADPRLREPVTSTWDGLERFR